jgi:hypothetical protein
MKARQYGLAMDSGGGFQQGPRKPVALLARPVGERGDRPRQLAVSVGLCELRLRPAGFAGSMLHRAVTQHELGKIDVELMGRHIGTFCHAAHVTQCTGIDYMFKINAVYGIQLARV